MRWNSEARRCDVKQGWLDLHFNIWSLRDDENLDEIVLLRLRY